MIIRDAQLADSLEIARLTTELGYPADATEIQARLEDLVGVRDQLLLVAVADQVIVGWLQAHASVVLESGFRVEIVGLIVSASARRRGVGRTLVDRAERWAIELGARVLVVRSNTARLESHCFYPALGFRTSKTQTIYRRPIPDGPNKAPAPTTMAVTPRAPEPTSK